MMKPDQLPFFVYGTLLPKQPNHSLYEAEIVSLEPATFSDGQLHDMGFYPMLVPAQDGIVQGMLVTVAPESYQVVQQRLDELEGYDPKQPDASAYRRMRVEVLLVNGRSQKAWTYLGQIQFAQNKPIIANGDWAAHAAAKQLELRDWWHTIHTVAGLHGK